jgi:hypothetical protein
LVSQRLNPSYQLVINLKIAKTLGLLVLETLLAKTGGALSGFAIRLTRPEIPSPRHITMA